MTGIRQAVLALVPWLWLAAPAWAGVYHTRGGLPQPTDDYRIFVIAYADYRTVPIPADKSQVGQESKSRGEYLKRLAELRDLERAGQLSVRDRIDLSEVYLRLREPEKAVLALRTAAAEEPANFMVLANLATANQQAQRLDRAAVYLRQALASFPAVWPGFSVKQLEWYRRAERFHLALIESRLAEERAARPRQSTETVDPLFPGVQFANARGEYTAGEIAPAQAALLPPDAVPLVEQLLLWLPGDQRLTWLLAELLNAQGEVVEAARLLDNLVYLEGFNSREVRRHRAVLIEGRELKNRLFGADNVAGQLQWALLPRGGTAEPGAGGLMAEAAAQAVLARLEGGSETKPAGTTTPTDDWKLEPRHVAVSFVAGAAVGILVWFQLREFLRRRLAPRRG